MKKALAIIFAIFLVFCTACSKNFNSDENIKGFIGSYSFKENVLQNEATEIQILRLNEPFKTFTSQDIEFTEILNDINNLKFKPIQPIDGTSYWKLQIFIDNGTTYTIDQCSIRKIYSDGKFYYQNVEYVLGSVDEILSKHIEI